MEKITKREMYEAIAEAMKTGECRYDPAEVISFCENEIDLLDKKAAKAKERAAANRFCQHSRNTAMTVRDGHRPVKQDTI